jgi:TM2 domain-containing membrane protein YozV
MNPGNDWLNSLKQTRNTSDKSWGIALALSIFLGFIGADRMYVGRIGLGLLKLLTLGGYCVWWVVDIILLLQGRMKDEFGRRIQRP